MTSDETEIQIFADWPMSHAKCMTGQMTTGSGKIQKNDVAASRKLLFFVTRFACDQYWPVGKDLD